ncbi:hypothetical protein M2333_002885 [Sphingobium sp. B11D3B]|uniref:hypothetical protein n=1 Tax=Sphingobium sp. B11D3B TaxID=2940575 RepID=UPI0022277D4D|nr:hypothetical protein [Sphingobium sp. B11D3B]MCW2389839.1 hypothetical protein [Sphingobium sp. B11D3B]
MTKQTDPAMLAIDRLALKNTILGGLPNQAFELIDRVAHDSGNLRERWNNRLVLEKTTLSEAYANGRLEIVLYGKALIVGDELSYAICISKCSAVSDNGSSDIGVETVNRNERDCRQDEVMFVVVVEGMEGPKRLVNSVGRPYFIKNQRLGTGEGLLYRRERGAQPFGSIGYEVLPVFPHWEMQFGLGIMRPRNTRAEVVQGPSEVVYGITDAKRDHLRNWFQRAVNQAKAGCLSIWGDEIRLNFDSVPFSAQRLGHGSDLINVAVGPLNF